MNIVQAIPRRMRFEARSASSVELCVAEWVSGSRYRATTTIIAERSDAEPLLNVAILRLAPARRLASFHLAYSIRRHFRGCADLIVTQQHIATAARIAALNPATPVVLQTHNLIDRPIQGAGAMRLNWLRRRELNSLAGITLVSQASLRHFEADWPEVTIPRAVITNGFDFRTWSPAAARENNIMVVGRNQPEKGILEAAQGCAAFLATRPDWRATFVLSEIERNPDYLAQVRQALAPVADRSLITSGIPFAEVKAMTEQAAIAIAASRWEEPFGRTALEAHAGGAALISSGSGGLAEISGNAAVFLPDVSAAAITTALVRLAADPELRTRLADEAALRVRRLFSLTRPGSAGIAGVAPVCERLDAFFERIANPTALAA